MVEAIDVGIEDAISNNIPTLQDESTRNQSELIFYEHCKKLVKAFEFFLEKKIEYREEIGNREGVDLFNSFWKLQPIEINDVGSNQGRNHPFIKIGVVGIFCEEIKQKKWSHSIEKEKLRVRDELSAHIQEFLFEILLSSPSAKQLNGKKELILKFREMMKEVNGYWKSNISSFEKSGDFSIYRDFAKARDICRILPNKQAGASGSYLMVNQKGEPFFVIKPMDEDIEGINNPHWGGLKTISKENIIEVISNYRLPHIDMMAHLIAKIAGIKEVTPEAVMMVVEEEQFYDFVGSLREEERALLDKELLHVNKEKLCSVQRFIPNAKNWYSVIQSLEQEKLTDIEIKNRIDQVDFENANLLMWLTNEEDGHGGNLLGYVKKYSEEGNPIWGIKKIDNGMCLGKSNGNFSNSLVYLPNSQEPLSEEGKEVIRHLDEERIVATMGVLELDTSIGAFQDRVCLLKEWVEEEGVTIHSINIRLQNIGNADEKSI